MNNFLMKTLMHNFAHYDLIMLVAKSVLKDLWQYSFFLTNTSADHCFTDEKLTLDPPPFPPLPPAEFGKLAS